MRTVVFIYGSFYMMVMLVAIMSIIISRNCYNDAIQMNLEESMEFAMQMLFADYEVVSDEKVDYASLVQDTTGYGGSIIKPNKLSLDAFSTEGYSENSVLKDNEQFKKKFVEYLVANLNNTVTGIEVNIYGADSRDGLLCAEVIASYHYPFQSKNSADAKVTCFKTIIIDREVKTDYSG